MRHQDDRVRTFDTKLRISHKIFPSRTFFNANYPCLKNVRKSH